MLTVATVLKTGGIYDAAWVAKLKAGVAKHLPVEHRFVCLSDIDVPCERIPLEHNWPGWWSKIELLRVPGPLLYFDLDTAIIGDLSEITAQAEKETITVLRDFYRGGDGMGSGVMAWNIDMSPVYDWFNYDPADWQWRLGPRGDQGFLETALNSAGVARWQDVVLGQVVSYKVHCRSGIPVDARVIALHGEPKFARMPANDPVRLAWEAAA